MISKIKPSFKIMRTDEKLTARSGLVIFGEFLREMNLKESLCSFPKPLNKKGYNHMEYALPLMLMMYAGGRSIADVREIKEDQVLRELLELNRVPSESAIGDWLKKMGDRGGIKAVDEAIDIINAKIFAQSNVTELTISNDPTIIETSKREAAMTYLGVKGYRPGLAFIKELGIVLTQEFRPGNDMGDKLEFLKSAFSKIPSNKKVMNALFDAEFYFADGINYLEEQGCAWGIAADQDAAVKAAIERIPAAEWKPLLDKDGFKTGKEVAETVHSMEKTKKAFRLVAIRWKDKKGNLCHHAIATNNLKLSANGVVWYYNQRAVVENTIKEVKGGFGMEKMPSGYFPANALYFAIGILTYNFFIAQKLFIMPASFQNKTIESIRWMLVEIPGKVIRHAKNTILKISASVEKFNIFVTMRKGIECLNAS